MKYKKNQQENRDPMQKRKIIDLILLLIMAIVSGVSFYIAYSFGLLPVKSITYVFAVYLVIFIVFLILLFVQIPTWALIIKRIFLVLLTVVIGFAGFYLDKSRKTLEKISTPNETEESGMQIVKTTVYVIALKNSSVETINDLENSYIGFQSGSDQENAAFAMEQISMKIDTYYPYEQLDYTTLVSFLETGGVRALAISENYFNMCKANITGFEDEVKIVETYVKETTLAAKIHKDITKETFVVYLSGLDSTGSPDQITRSDTNLLLIVNPLANHIDMVSLPRDAMMPNTAVGNINDKLTHTGVYGIDTSVATLEQFFGITIDYYARVSFNSLIEIIDAIDGIDVDVELDFCEQDENRSFAEDDLICLEAGEQHLNGKQALAYARHRKTAGYDNAGRERAQQRIIKAIIDKCLSASALTYINSLMDIAPSFVITDMPIEQITSFVSSELDNIQPWTISSLRSDTGVYDSQYVASLDPAMGKMDVYLYNQEEVQILLNAYDGASNQLKMSEFHFDLNDLYADCPQINDDPNIMWDFMAETPH